MLPSKTSSRVASNRKFRVRVAQALQLTTQQKKSQKERDFLNGLFAKKEGKGFARTAREEEVCSEEGGEPRLDVYGHSVSYSVRFVSYRPLSLSLIVSFEERTSPGDASLASLS